MITTSRRPWIVLLIAALILAGTGSLASAQSTPEMPPVASPAGTPVASPVSKIAELAELQKKVQADELGVVPVMMYHAFTSDPSLAAEYVKTLEDFRSDLQWLYDHDFHVISVRTLLENRIDVPAGKHPVVLTFDDSLASQFLIDKGPDGTYTPRPASGVGVLESFFAKHPDFGHTGFFAVVPNYCFSDSEIDEINAYATCDVKIAWLVAHGYEIGNHTLTHTDLGKSTPDQFAEEVGGTAQWIDERVTGPANMSRTLVLPYGGRPDPKSNPDVFVMLRDGFWYQGQQIILNGVFNVGGGPAYSPSSSAWNAADLPRVNVDPSVLDYWFTQFTNGDVILYTSDGNPDTVTVPNPVPDFLENEFDPQVIADSGKQLVRYDTADVREPSASTITGSASPSADAFVVGAAVITTDDGVRLRTDPSTEGDILATLGQNKELTIKGGPVEADGFTWWQVTTHRGTTGWIVEDFLANAPS